MITARRTFNYQGQVLIEKMTIQSPFHYEAMFQDRGCFIYFKETGPRLLSSDNNKQLQGNEAVLLKCGSHFIDLLKNAEEDMVEVLVVHFFPEILKKLYATKLPEIITKKKISKSSGVVVASHVLSKFIESLEFYFKNPSLVNNDLLELKIRELILLLIQSNSINNIRELIADLYSSKAVTINEVVELHLFSNLKLDQLAKLSNLSLSSFKREFKKEYNNSPTNYINTRRLEKAKEFLTLTTLTIREIAFEVGFQDSLYFTRLFKNKVGIPPSKYRSRNSV